MFRLGVNRKPFDSDDALASGATLSRFEHAATARDIYRASLGFGRAVHRWLCRAACGSGAG
jgi:hypothetical protein